jgi:hypothetical protein
MRSKNFANPQFLKISTLVKLTLSSNSNVTHTGRNTWGIYNGRWTDIAAGKIAAIEFFTDWQVPLSGRI